MTYDSDDSSLRAGDVENGGVGDFRTPRLRVKESGWHKFAIRCSGDTITYEMDGKPFHKQQDKRLTAGSCGVWFHNAFNTPPNSRGIRFAGFSVTK